MNINPAVQGLTSTVAALLSAFAVNPAPWTRPAANSEQRQPIYLGRSPRELALGLATPASRTAVLDEGLKALAERQLNALAKGLELPDNAGAEFEAWPTFNDDGVRTWAIPRWRSGADQPWRWLDAAKSAKSLSGLDVPPELPVTADLRTPEGLSRAFDDVLVLKSLYEKSLFGNCVWTTPEGDRIRAAWLTPEDAQTYRPEFEKAGLLCRAVSQPARLDGRPMSFVLALDGSGLKWPAEISWSRQEASSPETARSSITVNVISAWPADYAELYRKDVQILSGSEDAVFPLSGKTLRLDRRNNAEPDNRLADVVDYLAERYKALGIETRRQDFLWRGQKQSNLIAVLRAPSADGAPIVLADHIDTAFSEDEFVGFGRRVSVPGADDNAAASATLLSAAQVLKRLRLRRDVWLTHLTGEEFPADDLGARELVGLWLRERRDVGGVVLLDMIGFRNPGDRIIQINAGESAASLEMARQALGSAADVAADTLEPQLRTRFDPRSYLYNTDGLVFSDAGYPVVLINEHINKLENMDRPHYHEMTDLPGTLDWDYAAAVSKVAIETTARLAGASAPVLPAGALPIPIVRQSTPYSCGAAALLSVFYYWGVYDDGEASLFSEIGMDPTEGSDPRDVARSAQKHGLEASYKENVTLEELRQAWRRGETVIVDLQADLQISTTPWSARWEDGHYLVLVGIDDANAYFMDPTVGTGYTFIPLAELPERWHDYENRTGTVWRNQRLAIFIRGKTPISGFPGPLTPTQ